MSTILVVEDDDDLRELIGATLSAPDRTILEAEHGLAALDLIEQLGLPDLILLDMNMPIMSGWRFAEEMQARDLWRVPVIALTAAQDAASSAHAIGAAMFLGKPFSVRALTGLVNGQLGDRPATVEEPRRDSNASFYRR
jgi:CheY-like chemotaxis protein